MSVLIPLVDLITFCVANYPDFWRPRLPKIGDRRSSLKLFR